MKSHVLIPKSRCLSTLVSLETGHHYSAAAKKKLWDGKKVSPFLDFDRPHFVQLRREHSPHLSISGIQDKISLRLEKNRLTATTENGTYILKPAPNLQGVAWIEEIPANEHVTMQIASQIFRLPVAANSLLFFSDGSPAYLVRRFDYHDKQKLHQEDFCQLSNRSENSHGLNYKYNASYDEIGELLFQYCPAASVEALKLFRLILFNYLIGNGDAHLKNFSLLESLNGDMLLSPGYDLLNTTLHFPNEARTALDLFHDFETPAFQENGFYTSTDFYELGIRLRLPKKQIESIIAKYTASYPAIASLINRSFLSPAAQQAYLDIVADRMKALNV